MTLFGAVSEYHYKGYTGVARTEYVFVGASEPTYMYRGRVVGIRDAVMFVGEGTGVSVSANTEAEFRKGVDDYLESCASRGEEPEKP